MRLLLTLLLAVALVALVVQVTDLDAAAVGGLLSGLAPLPCLAAFVIYGASYVGRAWRLKLLLRSEVGLAHMASISARHNFFNALLPFRSGEATLPLMLRAEAGHALHEGAAMLFVCRVLDLLSVTTWLLLGLAWRRDPTADQSQLAVQALVVLAGVVAVVALMRPAATLCAGLAGTGGRLRRFVHDAGHRLAAVSPGQLFVAAAVSLATWAATYVACWLLVVAMADPAAPDGSAAAHLGRVDFATSLVGTTGLHLTGILPINTPAGVGAWEAGWTAGYVVAGVARLAAAASAVGTHILIFGFITVLGLLALLLRPTPLRPGPREHSLW